MRLVHVSIALVLTAAAFSCGPPSAIVRPSVPPEPVGVVNDNILAYQGSAAAGLEVGPAVAISPHSCEVLEPPSRGMGELRIRVQDSEQAMVLDLSGEALRRAWSSCTCGSRSMRHCVRIPPPPPPDTGRPGH